MVLVLLEVSLMKLILGISREIRWKMEALKDNSFILAFLYILQMLSIFRTNLFTWDPLHKRGVVDSHIREDPSFSWLVEIQTICRKIISACNLSKNYKNILQMCKDLDIEMKKLKNFQMTKFINLRTDYSPVRR